MKEQSYQLLDDVFACIAKKRIIWKTIGKLETKVRNQMTILKNIRVMKGVQKTAFVL